MEYFILPFTSVLILRKRDLYLIVTLKERSCRGNFLYDFYSKSPITVDIGLLSCLDVLLVVCDIYRCICKIFRNSNKIKLRFHNTWYTSSCLYCSVRVYLLRIFIYNNGGNSFPKIN